MPGQPLLAVGVTRHNLAVSSVWQSETKHGVHLATVCLTELKCAPSLFILITHRSSSPAPKTVRIAAWMGESIGNVSIFLAQMWLYGRWCSIPRTHALCTWGLLPQRSIAVTMAGIIGGACRLLSRKVW